MLSSIAAEHVSSPRNAGRFPEATHVGVGGQPGDGPYVRLWLLVEQGVILRAGYECNGCPSSIAAASMTSQLATGRPLERLALLEPSDLILLLGGLPEGKEYYAKLAVQAIRNAIVIEKEEKQ